jgi:hypothetical protein
MIVRSKQIAARQLTGPLGRITAIVPSAGVPLQRRDGTACRPPTADRAGIREASPLLHGSDPANSCVLRVNYGGSYARAWLLLALAAVAGVAFALTTRMTVSNAPAPVAHIAPVPSRTPAPTSPSKVVQVTSRTGPVCILPTGLPSGTLQIVKVPLVPGWRGVTRASDRPRMPRKGVRGWPIPGTVTPGMTPGRHAQSTIEIKSLPQPVDEHFGRQVIR